MPVEVFDDPIAACPLCGRYAIVQLPPILLAQQTDGTSVVCHPLHGGCNHGFARDPISDPRPGYVVSVQRRRCAKCGAVIERPELAEGEPERCERCADA